MLMNASFVFRGTRVPSSRIVSVLVTVKDIVTKAILVKGTFNWGRLTGQRSGHCDKALRAGRHWGSSRELHPDNNIGSRVGF